MSAILSASEIFKYEDRLKKFLDKIYNQEPFDTVYDTTAIVKELIVDGGIPPNDYAVAWNLLKEHFDSNDIPKLQCRIIEDGKERICYTGRFRKTEEFRNTSRQLHNMGNITEALLVLAIAARFNTGKNIDINHIYDIFNMAQLHSRNLFRTSRSKTKIVNADLLLRGKSKVLIKYQLDHINHTFLNTISWEDTFRSQLHNILDFVNSSALITERLNSNLVAISMVGLNSNQKDDINIVTGNHADLNLSIKTGRSRLISQRGGSNLEKVQIWLENNFGLMPKSHTVLDLYHALYHALESSKKSYAYWEHIASRLKHAATLDKDMYVLNFTNDYKVLDFNKLQSKLPTKCLSSDLKIVFQDLNRPTIKLMLNDQLLFQLRNKLEKSNYSRNYLEIGNGLIDMVDISSV